MIKKAAIDDINKIVELEVDTLGSSLGYKMLVDYLDNPLISMYTYSDGGNLLGYISLSFDGDVIEIYNFCVNKNHQNKGIGTELLSYVLNFYYALGANRSILEVRSSNINAISLYEKFGFKTIHIRKKYYSNGEDALMLEKKFISYLELEDKYLDNFSNKQIFEDYNKRYDSIQPDKYYHNFYELKNNDMELIDKLINLDDGIICYKTNNIIKDKFDNVENNIYMHSTLRGIKILGDSKGIVKEVNDFNSKEVESFLYNDGLIYGEKYASSNSKRLVELTNYPNMKAFVIYDDDKIIGYIHIFIYMDFAKMEDFFILDDYQRKGYGSTLFVYALNYLKNMGVNDVCIVADNDDTPKFMYERMGFVKIGEYYFYRK